MSSSYEFWHQSLQLDERNRLILNLLRLENFEAIYGFAPLWPRAVLDVSHLRDNIAFDYFVFLERRAKRRKQKRKISGDNRIGPKEIFLF